jgi:hypothetical protein
MWQRFSNSKEKKHNWASDPGLRTRPLLPQAEHTILYKQKKLRHEI